MATDKLAGYRGDQKSNVPQPVEDTHAAPPAAAHEGEDAARAAATAPTPAAPLSTGDRTPAFVDRQRQRLAERFKAVRAAERQAGLPASHVPFIDGDNPAIPGALPGEAATSEPTADPDAEAEAREKKEAEEAAARAAAASEAPSKPQTYTLKVDGNQFTVSREELLRYAEIDAADASEFSEPALVRLAQKQIAASNRLAEANALKDQIRKQAASPAAPQPQEPRPAIPAPAGRPDAALISAVEKIQLGDPEEAAKAIAEVFQAGMDQAIRANNQTLAIGSVQDEYTAGVNEFSKNHPDVIADKNLASAHIAFVAREIADDIQALGLVDEAKYAAIATNPRLAADVLTAARAERRPVRAPGTIFEAAFDKLAALTGQRAQTQAPAPPTTITRAAPDRIAEKRALMPTPARSGISQIGAIQEAPQQEDRRAAASAAIQKMRKARFQPTA